MAQLPSHHCDVGRGSRPLGEARTVAPSLADHDVTDPQDAYHLAQSIERAQSIPADAIVVRQNWLRAYELTTDRGDKALYDYAHRPASIRTLPRARADRVGQEEGQPAHSDTSGDQTVQLAQQHDKARRNH